MMRLVTTIVAVWLLGLPATAREYQVPFSIGRCQLMVVEVKVNGKPATFVLDTGATVTVVDAKVVGVHLSNVDRFNLALGQPGILRFSGTQQINLRLGDYKLHKLPVRVLDFGAIRKRCVPDVDGLVGQDVLRKFKQVVIDYKAKEIRFVK